MRSSIIALLRKNWAHYFIDKVSAGILADQIIDIIHGERDIAISALKAIKETYPENPKLPMTHQIKDIVETALNKLEANNG